jgi:hypothetical protein
MRTCATLLYRPALALCSPLRAARPTQNYYRICLLLCLDKTVVAVHPRTCCSPTNTMLCCGQKRYRCLCPPAVPHTVRLLFHYFYVTVQRDLPALAFACRNSCHTISFMPAYGSFSVVLLYSGVAAGLHGLLRILLSRGTFSSAGLRVASTVLSFPPAWTTALNVRQRGCCRAVRVIS